MFHYNCYYNYYSLELFSALTTKIYKKLLLKVLTPKILVTHKFANHICRNLPIFKIIYNCLNLHNAVIFYPSLELQLPSFLLPKFLF